MHYSLTNIQADFGMNRPIRYQITAKRNYLHRRTDGQTDERHDRRTDGQTSRTTIGIFFQKKKKILKTIFFIEKIMETITFAAKDVLLMNV